MSAIAKRPRGRVPPRAAGRPVLVRARLRQSYPEAGVATVMVRAPDGWCGWMVVAAEDVVELAGPGAVNAPDTGEG